MRDKIQTDPPGLQKLGLLFDAASSQNRLYPRHERLGRKGLGDVLVNPNIKSLQLILLIGLGRQDDDRHLGRLPDLSGHIKAAELRQHDV